MLQDYIGNTPLVTLQRLGADLGNRISVKLEGSNPAGSVKDRAAFSMIDHAQARGDIKPGDALVEATSGNTGIALAMVAAMRGYRLTLVMPDNMSHERVTTMRAYGAEIILVSEQEGMMKARDIAVEMDAAGKAKMLDQFANPDNPRTAFGAMIAALKKRRDNGTGPFTGQSCDNLQGNGTILRQTVVSLAKLSDPDLADWIDCSCSFPNSMVDCIVPATGPKELDIVRSFGIEDAAPVTHENYRQWVIEDDFCAGRPDWDKAGATFTDDVHAFEAMKIRILN